MIIEAIGRGDAALATTLTFGFVSAQFCAGFVIVTPRLVTFTEAETFAVAPTLSVTVTLTVSAPAFVYMCDAELPLAMAPSPKSIVVDAMTPSVSLEPVLVTVSAVPVNNEAADIVI